MTTPDVPPTPDVPLRVELTFELPGSPEQVWDAIATANGISSWFLRTDIEEREGGALAIHMGETDSEGTVTGWEPPRRLVYEEPSWAALAGQEGAPVTPLVSEYLVEAKSGGTCVLRVVASAYGTGADWENEFFEEMTENWVPFFDNLRLYLEEFPGQQVTSLEVSTQIDGGASGVLAAIRRDLGGGDAGDTVDGRGLVGRVHRTDPMGLLVRVDAPVAGFMSFYAFDVEDGKAVATVTGWLFSDGAAQYVELERDAWKAWLEDLTVTAS
jgi:uncharacterized protein YndB with AHSA1/START domain